MDDPYTVIGNMKVATGVMFLQGFAQIAQTGSTLGLPIFAIHGTEDRVTSPKVSRASCMLESQHAACVQSASTVREVCTSIMLEWKQLLLTTDSHQHEMPCKACTYAADCAVTLIPWVYTQVLEQG